MNFDPQAVGDKAHYARRFDPWDLFQLRLLLGKGNKENVSTDVGAHDFHDLRLGDVFHSGYFDVVTGLDAETPGALAVVVEHSGSYRQNAENRNGDKGPQQAMRSFLRKRSAPGGNTFLGA